MSKTPTVRPLMDMLSQSSACHGLDSIGMSHPKTVPGSLPLNRVITDSELDHQGQLLIVMVGLPARGKSYITKKVCRYLNWLQYETKIFNVGDSRRRLRPISTAVNHPSLHSASSTQAEQHDATFFDPRNEAVAEQRNTVAMQTLQDSMVWLHQRSGAVAMFDATNTTRSRREAILSTVKQLRPNLQVLFLESQCFDDKACTARVFCVARTSLTSFKVLEMNMRLKLSGPDYRDQNPVQALQDFKRRISMYERVYEPLGRFEESKDYSFCQMIDVGRKFVLHNVTGFLASQVVQYLQHFQLRPRQIWLTRHGESFHDASDGIICNDRLTPNGKSYARSVALFIEEYRAGVTRRQDKSGKMCNQQRFQVWTSNKLCSIETAHYFDRERYCIKYLKTLGELNASLLRGLTRDDIRALLPTNLRTLRNEPATYHFPLPEEDGYLEMISRLKSVILELERTADHMLIISGLAITRVLLAYFRGLRKENAALLDVPNASLFLLEPNPYGVQLKQFIWKADDMTFEEKILN